MKIIHAHFCFYPDPVGGTEVYVRALVHYLRQYQVKGVIAVPGTHNQSYFYEGSLVRRFALSAQISDIRELYGDGDVQAAIEFARLLDEETPDLVHLHAFTRGVSLRLVRAAKQRQIPVIFTYHTPTVSCARGTLMRWGNQLCDGYLTQIRCTRCVLHEHGLNCISNTLLGSLPPEFGVLLGRLGRSGGLWTALRMSELITLRHLTTHRLFDEVDHIVAVSHWVKELLQHNDVPEHKITVCRHGLTYQTELMEKTKERVISDQLRLVFLGRLEPTKGIDTIVGALHSLPNAPITLDIYGIWQDKEETPYQKSLQAMIMADPRIRLYPPIASDRVVSLLHGYDALVVPSRWLETGPLVVLEAFAAGIPVIGSKLGGIPEWVEDGVNGLLVEAGSVLGWMQTLQRIIDEPILLQRLTKGISTPRSMQQVSNEILDLYSKVISSKR